jgi:uncharacterized protein YcfJ
MSKPAVFGLVKNEVQAQSAIAALEEAGFSLPDISVLSNDWIRAQLGAGDTTLSYPTVPEINGKTREVGLTNTTKAPEGAATGGVAGGVLGGVAGWLIGIGALAIPAVGPFVAAGPILAALSGAAIGATAGGLVGALVGYGIPEYEAKLYAGKLEGGHILIGVHAVNSQEAVQAKNALARVGAEDIKVTSEVPA